MWLRYYLQGSCEDSLLRLVRYCIESNSLLQYPFTLPTLNIMVSLILSTYIEQHNRCNFCFNRQIQFKNLLKSLLPIVSPILFLFIISQSSNSFSVIVLFVWRASVGCSLRVGLWLVNVLVFLDLQISLFSL